MSMASPELRWRGVVVIVAWCFGTWAVVNGGEETKPRQGWIGLVLNELSKVYVESYEVPERGALVKKVYRGSPAEQAGVLPGDQIYQYGSTAFDRAGRTVKEQLEKILAETTPDQVVTLKILRDTKNLEEVSLTIRAVEKTPFQEIACRELGMTVSAWDEELADAYQVNPPLEHGVMVRGVDKKGAAELGKLRPGDVIDRINHVPIKDLQDYQRLVEGLEWNKLENIPIAYYRDDRFCEGNLRVNLAKLFAPPKGKKP